MKIDKKFIVGLKKSYVGYRLVVNKNELRLVSKVHPDEYGVFPDSTYVMKIPSSLAPKIMEWYDK